MIQPRRLRFLVAPPILAVALCAMAHAEPTKFFSSPSELRDELAVHEFLPGLYAGSELEGQFEYEKARGERSTSDTYFDAVTGALRWLPFEGLDGSFEGSYDLHDSEGWTTDEATMTFGAIPAQPWYIAIGRTALPFGEFNSHFRTDPITQFLGEIQGKEIQGGYETDTLELSFAMRDGNSGRRSFSWVSNLTFSPIEDLDVGVFGASDLTQAFEIKQLIQTVHEENDPGTSLNYSPVGGFGAFMSLQNDRYSIDFEYIAAVDKFKTGLISDDEAQPWAWNFEAVIRPTGPWEIGLRCEGSSELPDAPDFQYGLETSYGFGAFAAVSLEWLKGSFDDRDRPDRNLVVAGLLLRW